MSRSEKKSGLLLLGITILKGLSDTVGVASVIPFLSVLGQPDIVKTNPYATKIYDILGFTSIDNFLFALGLLVICVLVFNALLNGITVYATNRWIEMRQHHLSRRLLETYLRRPYTYFLTRNTSDMSTSILSLSRSVVTGAYKPFVNLVNSLITLVLITSLLIWSNPNITLIVISTVIVSYTTLYISLRGIIRGKGQFIVKTNRLKFRRVSEILTGIKQVKLSGYENYALDRYSEPSQGLAEARSITATLNQIPRFGLEAIAFGGIVILTLFLFKQSGGVENGGISKSLPLLGLYAFAGFRLLPIMQTIYGSVIALRLNAPAVTRVFNDIKDSNSLPKISRSTVNPMHLSDSIVFKSVRYSYPGSSTAGLKNIDLKIPKGISLGIVGTTGAGKTTLVDVLLGLLNIDSGMISIDGTNLNQKNIRSWQSIVGYVPQEIFLYDASISENIAMGIPKSQISIEQINYAAKASKLYDFINKNLPEKFDTVIGERGVRLSGGQRQRLGIARALYKNPQIIVFDEATSALDNTTERELISEISQMSGERTIIMIAHRLTTIENCDQIVILDNGEIAAKGTYAELLQNSQVFKKMASHLE